MSFAVSYILRWIHLIIITYFRKCCLPWATYWATNWICSAEKNKINKKELDTVLVSVLTELHKTCILVRGILKGYSWMRESRNTHLNGNTKVRWNSRVDGCLAKRIRQRAALMHCRGSCGSVILAVLQKPVSSLLLFSGSALSLCSTNFPPLLLILLTSVSYF